MFLPAAAQQGSHIVGDFEGIARAVFGAAAEVVLFSAGIVGQLAKGWDGGLLGIQADE